MDNKSIRHHNHESPQADFHTTRTRSSRLKVGKSHSNQPPVCLSKYSTQAVLRRDKVRASKPEKMISSVLRQTRIEKQWNRSCCCFGFVCEVLDLTVVYSHILQTSTTFIWSASVYQSLTLSICRLEHMVYSWSYRSIFSQKTVSGYCVENPADDNSESERCYKAFRSCRW